VTGERQHHNVTLAILTAAGTAYSLMQTMVVPALPAFREDLHTTNEWATWVLTGFLLVSAVATPVLGKLGDQHGKERFLVVSLALFFVGCVGAAAAWNIWSLIAFRAVQGLGGAVFPLSFGIIRDEFPREKIGVAIGLISAVFGVGGGFGIVLAGLIVDHASWRWLFVVGAIPVGVSALLVARFIPESPVKSPSRIDIPGVALLSAGLVALLLALTEAPTWGWSSDRIVALFAGAAVLLLVWIAVELRVPEPLVDMRMMAKRQVLFTNITAIIAGFAMFGAFVLIPNFVETPRAYGAGAEHVLTYGFNATATTAGLYLLPSSLTLLFAGPLAGLLGRRVGSKWPLTFGMAFVAIAAALLAAWHDHPWEFLVATAILGVGVGFAFAAMATLITEAVRATETGVATGMNTVMRTVGGVVGGQMGAALLTAYTVGHTGLPSVTGYEAAFTASAIGAVAGAGAAIFVTPLGLNRPAFLRRAFFIDFSR
jgi:EmrB/QacA subfamily drug resistance transporter